MTKPYYTKTIKELRESRGMTQQEVADYLGTSQTMYARYERGANEMPIRHLIALCHLYKVSAIVFWALTSKNVNHFSKISHLPL